MAINNVLLANQFYLTDREFLAKLDREKNKVLFAKIIALTIDEDPIEEIQGRVTQGNVTIDGKSCVRRTCSASIVANELNIHDYYWGLNTKFQFLIGCKNNIEPKYPEIIWFKMGTYLISSFSTSQTVNSYTISIQGKDKMCMLNGEIGGVITPLTWDFGTIENIQNDGSKIVEKYLIKNIITEAVHEHAREPWHNIIVNDLDDLALELLEYRGDKTMYLLYSLNKRMVTNFVIPADENVTISSEISNIECPTFGMKFKDVKFDPRVSSFKLDAVTEDVDIFYLTENGHRMKDESGEDLTYTIIKVEYGETIGYRLTDLVYAGDLISNVGESVTSMLDKIVQMLGNYEYFYNVDGQFIFQRKPVYYEASWNNIVKKQDIEYIKVDPNDEYDNNKMYMYKDGMIMHEFYENSQQQLHPWQYWVDLGLMYYVTQHDNYVDNTLGTERYVYNFNDNILITSLSNAPNLLNLKNDYSIWGKRSGVSGAEIPIHLRYAIDKKPIYYKNFDGIEFVSEEGKQEKLNWYDKQIADIQREKNLLPIPTGDNVFLKEKVPEYLRNEDGSSDWWDIINWAEYYKLLTGEEPSQRLMNYGTISFKGVIHFPNGEEYNCNRGQGQLIFDTNRITHNKYIDQGQANQLLYNNHSTSSWSAFQHGFNGCGHTYTQFLKLNRELTNPPMQSFIYNPQIPEGTITVVDEDYYNIIDTGTFDEEIERLQAEKEEYDNNTTAVDWRELIYQMALDYRKHNHDEDYHVKIIQNNLTPFNESLYPRGYTGYEPYYIDLEGFWRQLYDPEYTYTPEAAYVTPQALTTLYANYYVWEQTNTTHLNSLDKDYYYRDYLGRYVKVKSTLEKINEQLAINPNAYWYLRQCTSTEQYESTKTYYELVSNEFDPESHWSRQVIENPAGLNFWFDFLEGDVDLERYNVQNIGDRPKAENDDKVKAIYFRDIPEVIFVDKNVNSGTVLYEQQQRPGYAYVRLPDHLLNNLFTTSRQGKSAMDKLETFLYQYACCTESITLSSLPVYYLEPNTRILVDDNNSNLHGEYLIERLSIPLSTNGTMSITATKAIEKLY